MGISFYTAGEHLKIPWKTIGPDKSLVWLKEPNSEETLIYFLDSV